MNRTLLILVLTSALVSNADESVPVSLRGKTVTLARIDSTRRDGTAVIFIAGDGGWRGEAMDMARTIASWGYEVYGFDTKRYLETFSQDGAKLSRDAVADDLRRLAEHVGNAASRPVVLVGWSQGAGMAVAAASGAASSGKEAHPAFAVKPLLGGVAPAPIWMIRGSSDEYTTPETARQLFQAASEPKRLCEIASANHRFDGHREELYRSMKEGLEWITSN